jgi:2,3-bisphosphoglycerate-independent phosphoglycerate mutase
MLVLHRESPDVDGPTCRVLQKAIRHYQEGSVAIEFVPTRDILGVLRLSGAVSAQITDSNPMAEGRPLMEVLPFAGCEDRTTASATARAMNEYLKWCYRTLSRHPRNVERSRSGRLPANAVGTQRPGMKRPLRPFREKWGLRCLSISSGPVYYGLCSLLSIENQPVTETADPEKDLRRRLRLAKKASGYDFIHVHTKAPDEASHTKDPQHKKAVIESLDRALEYALDELAADDEVLLVVTADHSTASTGAMIHSGETVPLTFVGQYARRDAVSSFDEVSCAAGGLGQVRGKELMYLILNMLDRGKLWGTMDSPVNQPFVPGKYKALRIR